MTIKKCTCGETITTKNAERVSRNGIGLWFTCSSCGSTSIKKGSKNEKKL